MVRELINTLEVSGYKSIRSAQLELRPLNVLIGPNGAGKSNLASIFSMLQWNAKGQLAYFVARSGGANNLFHFGTKTTEVIRIMVEGHISTSRMVYVSTSRSAAGDRLWSIEFFGRRTEQDEAQPNTTTQSPAGIPANHPGEALANQNDIFGLFERIGIYHFHDTTNEARIRQHGDIDDNRRLHGDGHNLAAFLYKLQQVKPEFFNLIVKHVRLVAPFFDTFVLTPNPLNPRTIILRWRERDHADEFGVHVLSDGTLRFIALAALLLQPPEDLPPVVFIDEPELGLHPYAIAILASLLKQASRHCQVIVATQSPGLLDHFEPQDVIVVDRVNGATEFRRKSPEELVEWLEDYTLSELWYKNVLGGSPSR
jgi:predicted ATPase